MRDADHSEDPTIVLDTRHSRGVHAVAFHPDGMHLLGGGGDGIRRWQLVDGQEVGKQEGMDVRCISVSRDRRWVVCGTFYGASVWDAELREKVIDVEGTNWMRAVDVCPDSTRFATGNGYREVSVWDISSGERLVGPLQHERTVTGIRFSPHGELIAATCWGSSVRVFDSRTGDALITIKTTSPSVQTCTPLAWSNDGQRIFATSDDSTIKCFNVSTGSQLVESQILKDGENKIESIALATSGKFIATYAGHTIAFLDASTLARIGPFIEESGEMYSITLSPDCNYVATGRRDGKVAIRNLGSILPNLYGPFYVNIWHPFCLPR